MKDKYKSIAKLFSEDIADLCYEIDQENYEAAKKIVAFLKRD